MLLQERINLKNKTDLTLNEISVESTPSNESHGTVLKSIRKSAVVETFLAETSSEKDLQKSIQSYNSAIKGSETLSNSYKVVDKKYKELFAYNNPTDTLKGT